MKAMSKFFLIIAGVLLVIGAILMIIGSIMAKNNGIQLFQEKVDGKYLYNLDLSEKDINKISIDATDTDIVLKTGEDKEYVEFINFNENYYSLTTTNKVVKFEEHVSLNSLISFWDGNFRFKGMRSFLHLGSSLSGQKEVIIHLNDTSAINVFSFTITDGDITIENADSNTDYTITMDSGNVSMKNVTTDSKVMINGNNCFVNFENCNFKYFASDIATVNMNADIDSLKSFEFTGKSGTVNAALGIISEPYDVKISSDSASPILFNGEEYTGVYANNEKMAEVPEEYGIVHITGGALDTKLTLEIKAPEITEDTK